MTTASASATSSPPKVSVLLPNYNYARFLPEAIGSVLEQDFADFELLVSDDASDDGSAEAIHQWARRDSRIRPVLQPSRLGLAAHFNWCLQQARGQYVKFLLADDKFTGPDSLARLVRLLEQGSDVVLASSAVNLIGEQSEFLKARDYLGRDLLEAGGTTARRCLLSGRNQIGEPSVFIFRRSCAGSGFNPSYRLWIDVEFALRVLEQGRFAYTTQPLTAFRMHDRQQTRRLMEENLLWIEHYRLLRDFAGRSWLGREQARQRLFEALYQLRKKPDAPPEVQRALATAIADLGGEAGYTGFRLRRKLCRPLAKLRRYLFPSAASPG